VPGGPIPGHGTALCAWPRKACGEREIEGLGFCLHHVPDEDLAEAEAVTGFFRCRIRFGQPDACRNYAVKATSPPCCNVHGATIGGTRGKGTARKVVEGRVTDRLVAIMGEHGDRLLNPGPAPDPLTGLLQLADEMNEWRLIMRDVVAYLLDRDRIRSAHDRVGEQLRAEVLLYERAIERLAQLWERIIKLGIEARMAKIEDIQVQAIETALDTALAASGLGLVEREKARGALRRELVKAAA
jgi:hypothetical protein